HACVQWVRLGGTAREFSEDFAAADGLRLQERQIVRELAALLGALVELLGNDRNGGERSTKLVRRCGRQAIECVQLLLACPYHLAGCQRVRHLPGLLGEPPCVKRQEQHARQHRREQADVVEQRQIELGAAVPRQRQAIEQQQHRGEGSEES